MNLKPYLTRRALSLVGAAALAATVFGAGASAQSVDDILARKKVQIGVLVDLPPFGLLNTQGQPEGYDVDVAKLVGKYMGVEVEIVPVTGPNRIPYLLTNKVDMLVATFGITPERAKQVMFSIPYSAIEIQLIGTKKTKISKIEDTAGMKISVPRASTPDTALTAIVPKGANIMRFDDDASAAQAFLSGQVELFGDNNVIGAQLAAAHPGNGDRAEAHPAQPVQRHHRAPRLLRAAAVAQHLHLLRQEQWRARHHQEALVQGAAGNDADLLNVAGASAVRFDAPFAATGALRLEQT